jgi:serine/threonine-protein kinase HipA
MNGVRVGLLKETEKGTRFEYDDDYVGRDYAVAISPTMPLSEKSFSAPGMLPFFANLLPEGSRLAWASQRLGLDQNDRFGILLATARDTIGAIEIHAESSRSR